MWCWIGLGACLWCWAKPGLAHLKPVCVGISSLPGHKSQLCWGFSAFRTHWGEPAFPTEHFGVKSLGFGAALGDEVAGHAGSFSLAKGPSSERGMIQRE